VLLSASLFGQRIKPNTRIEKSNDTTSILLSDVNNNYQHTQLIPGTGITFTRSAGGITVSSSGGGNNLTVGEGFTLTPDGADELLERDWPAFTTSTTFDGNEYMVGYSTVTDPPIYLRGTIQDVLYRVLTSQDGTVSFVKWGTNQIDLSATGAGGGTTQSLTFTSPNLGISGGNTVDISAINTDDQTIDQFSLSGNTLSLSLESDGQAAQTVDLSGLVDDADADPTNELQTLSLTGSDLEISGGNIVDLSSLGGGGSTGIVSAGIGMDATYTGSDVRIDIDITDFAQPGYWQGNFFLAGAFTNDDTNYPPLAVPTNQMLLGSLISSDGSVSITQNGNSVDLKSTGSGGGTFQSLTFTSPTLAISDGNSVDLSAINTDDQQLSLSGTILSLESGGAVDIGSAVSGVSSIATTAGLDNSASTGAVTVSLDLSEIDNANLMDGNDYLVGHMATGEEQRGTIQDILLSTLTSTDGSVSFGANGSTQLNVTASGGSGGTTQNLTFTSPNLGITDGNTIDISAINTDDQNLSLVGTNLSIDDGNSVNLSGINTDAQTLSFSGSTLSITNGNSVTIPSGYSNWRLEWDTPNTWDNIENGETVRLTGTTGLEVENLGVDVEFRLVPAEFSIDNTISASDYIWTFDGTGTVQRRTQISALPVSDSDNQTLSLSGSTLSISGGNSVTLPDGGGGSMSSFNIQANSGLTEPIGDGETINFIPGSGMSISRTGNDLTFSSTSGGSGVSSISTSPGLDNSASTGTVDISLDLSEISTTSTMDGNDYLVGYLSTGTEQAETVQQILLNSLVSSNNSVSISSSGTAVNLTTSSTDDQTLSLSGNTLSIESGNSVTLPSGYGGWDLQVNSGTEEQIRTTGENVNLVQNGNMTITRSGNTVYFAADDNQSLSLSGSTLSLTNSASVSLPYNDGFNIRANTGSTTLIGEGEVVSFQQNGNMSISRVGNTMYFAATDSDDQTLSLSGSTLSISGGNSVTLPSGTNYSDWRLEGDDFEWDLITDGETVDFVGGTGLSTDVVTGGLNLSLAPLEFSIDNTISSGDYLWTFTSGGIQRRTQISALPLNDSDNQTLSVSGSTLSISGGNAVSLPSGMSGFYIREDVGTQDYIQNGELITLQSGSNVSITRPSANTFQISATAVDDQFFDVLSLSGTTLNISLDGDGQATRTLSLASLVNDADASTTNELQSLSLSGSTLSISNGNSVTLPTGSTYTSWTLQGDDGATDAITNSELVDITGGSGLYTDVTTSGMTITLAPQEFTFDNTISSSDYVWTFDGSGTVQKRTQISALPLNDSDNQTLSLSGSTLSISGGNSVNLPSGTSYSGWTAAWDGGGADFISDGETHDFNGGLGILTSAIAGSLTDGSTLSINEGIGLDVFLSGTTYTPYLDFSELPDVTTMSGTGDKIIITDNGTEAQIDIEDFKNNVIGATPNIITGIHTGSTGSTGLITMPNYTGSANVIVQITGRDLGPGTARYFMINGITSSNITLRAFEGDGSYYTNSTVSFHYTQYE